MTQQSESVTAEPFAWVVLSEETGNTRMWTRNGDMAKAFAAKHLLECIELYRSPVRAPSQPAAPAAWLYEMAFYIKPADENPLRDWKQVVTVTTPPSIPKDGVRNVVPLYASQAAASGGVAELKAEIERLTDNVVVPRISEDEFPGLKATISLWMDRMIQASQAVSGSVQAVVAHPVARVRALPDALQENVLLTVEAPSGEQMTLSFPPAIADYIVSEVGRVRDELRPDRSKPS